MDRKERHQRARQWVKENFAYEDRESVICVTVGEAVWFLGILTAIGLVQSGYIGPAGVALLGMMMISLPYILTSLKLNLRIRKSWRAHKKAMGW